MLNTGGILRHICFYRRIGTLPIKKMKRISLKYFSIMIAVILISLTASSCHHSQTPTSPVNNDLINFKDFSVSAEIVGLSTFVRGTVFVKGTEDKPGEHHVQIAAWTEIDEMDWGGISFYIPRGWEVTDITSDYPQGSPKPEEYIGIWHTEAEEENFNTFVEIGHTKFRPGLNQGGKGNLIIELAPILTKQELPEILEIRIGAGSKGEYTVNPVVETISIPLNTRANGDD